MIDEQIFDQVGEDERRSDAGNARRLVALYGHELRYVPPWGIWLHWDGRRWQRDHRGVVVERAKQVAAMLWEEALREPDPDQRKAAVRWALQSENAGRIRAMVELARTIESVPVMPEELDADTWSLNLTNGVLDLRSGRLLSHDPRRLITKLAHVAYDTAADAPRWRTFLEQILPDAEVREFVARWSGYCLTGDISEHKVVFAFGSGSNGKSVFTGALAHMLGDYAGQAAPDLLMRRREDPHPTGLADLQGQRLVLATETAQQRRIDEALLKRLTGGDPVKARFMFRDFFEFPPTHKFVVATNHRPGIEGIDHGIWRRIRLVPFAVTIQDEDQDHHLDEKLAGEAAGILRWAVDGCLRWQAGGLTEPMAVVAATADYRAEMDVLGEFISECCLLDSGVSARASDLYGAYCRWAEAMGETAISQRKLGLSLRERGLQKRTSNGVRWDGIGLRIGTMEPSEASSG